MTSDVPGIGSNAATLARSQARSDKVEADLAVHPDKWRILTGDRPTGSLHIGHYFGSLANRVRLQSKGIESFLVVADYQVIYCLLYTSPSPRDISGSRMPSSA